MGKVTKILLSVLCATVLCLVILPLAAALLLMVPAVQSALCSGATSWLMDRYSVRADVGSIRLRRYSRLDLGDVYLEDAVGDTLLFARHVSADLNTSGVFRGGALIGGVTLEGADIRIESPASGRANVGQLADRIRSQARHSRDGANRESSGVLTLRNIRMTDSRFRLHKQLPPAEGTGINFRDMDLSGVEIDIPWMEVCDGRISMDLERLSFVDRTGVSMDRLAARRMSLHNGELAFSDLRIEAMDGRLSLDTLALVGRSWKTYRFFKDSVLVLAQVRGSDMNTRMLSGFVRSVDISAPMEISGVDADFEGSVSDFRADVRRASVGRDLTLGLRGSAQGLGTGQLRASLDTLVLSGSGEAVAAALHAMGKGSDRLGSMLTSLGQMRLGAAADIGREAQADLRVSSSVGDVSLSAVSPVKIDGHGLKAVISATGLNVGAILGSQFIGSVSLDASVIADVDGADTRGSADISVGSAVLGGRSVRDLSLSAALADRVLRMTAESDAEDAAGTLSGSYSFPQGAMPSMGVDAVIDRYAVYRTVRDTTVRNILSASLKGRATGHNPDDMTADIGLSDILYVTPEGSARMSSLSLVADSDAGSHTVSVRSDFADLDYSSNVSYTGMVDAVKDNIYRFFPVLAPQGYVRRSEDRTGDRISLDLMMRNAGELLAGITDTVSISPDSRVRVDLNDGGTGRLVCVQIPYMELGEFLAENLDIDLTRSGDSLLVDVASTSDVWKGYDLTSLTLSAAASDSRFSVRTGFGTPDSSVALSLGAAGAVRRENGRVSAVLGLEDSFLVTDGSKWNIECDSLLLSGGRVATGLFRMHGQDGDMRASGAVAGSGTDTLGLELLSLRLGAFSPFLEKSGYRLDGVLSGTAELMSVGGARRLNASAGIDSLSVNGFSVKPLSVKSAWNPSEAQVYVSVENRADGRRIGEYRLNTQTGAYTGDVSLSGVPLALLGPKVEPAVGDLSGNLSLDASLSGGPDMPMGIDGNLSLSDVYAAVPLTGVSYRLPSLSAQVSDGVLNARQARILDSDGGQALLDLSADLRNLRRVTYDLRLSPRNLLVLDREASAESPLYGHLLLSGNVALRPSGRNMSLTGALSADGGSQVSLSLRGSSDFSIADYVTFQDFDAVRRPDTLTMAQLRRRQYDRRREESRRRSSGGLTAEMSLSAAPDMTFNLLIDPDYNNMLTANGNATLDVRYDSRSGDLGLSGRYEISSGTYNFNIQNLVSKKFTLEPGSRIVWTGSPMDATLDISTSYRLKTYLSSLTGQGQQGKGQSTNVDCIVNITGALSEPQFSFDVNLPNADSEYQSIISSNFSTQEQTATQFFYLLAFGVPYSDSSAQNLNIGANTGAAIGFDFLTSQIRNLMSAENMNFNLRYTPKSEMGSDEYGFYFQNDLVENRLVLELEGNYDTGNNPAMSTNRLSAGGTLTYYIDPSGNLLLRGFSRTMDRFDENQGLQENGVGLYYKEEFDNFKDFWKRLGRRLSRKDLKKDNNK